MKPYIDVRISELLAQGGLSPEQLSETADIPQEELSGILAGSVTPNIDILAKIAKALNTSMDFLIGSVPYSEMISSEEEEDIIRYYREMSKRGKRLFMGALENLKDK